MVFAGDVSGSVPVHQGDKLGYFSGAYNMIQEIMSLISGLSNKMREMSRFRIGACNCQALQDYKKRADVFKWLKRKKLDICCLVDTHCKNDAGEAIKWSNEWGYKGFFSSFNSQIRGIAVLFSDTFEYKLHAPPVNDPEGRFCILDLTLFQQRFTLAVVYGPNNDDTNFILQLSEKLEQ